MRAPPLYPASLALAAVGGVALLVGAQLDPRRAAFAWLAAWMACATAALGALALVMIHHLTGSTWFIVLRRVAEQIGGVLPLLALLFLPVLLAMPALYPWLDPHAELPHHLATTVEKKRAYLNGPFFAIRAALYFAVWIASAELLARASRHQDRGDGARLARRLGRLSVPALLLSALALHFAAVDWIQSLEPAWYSSMFGVYFFAASLLAGLALLVVVAGAMQRAGELGELGPDHFHALGKLLHTFVIFWAYVAFFQFFIIWIAGIPEETSWFVPRTEGRWLAVSVLLVAGHFALPFLLLLSRARKRNAARLGAVAAWLLAMHYVDVYWLVMPALQPRDWSPHWIDAAALVAVGGALVGCAHWRARGTASVARGDPRLERSLHFRTR